VELQDYARAIAGRWVWLVAGGAVGLVLAALPGVLGTAEYGSTVSLYVGADRVTAQVDDDPGYAAQVQTEILPSVAELAGSTLVSAPVVDSLHLPVSASELAGKVTVSTATNDSRLDIAVSDPDPARARAAAEAVGAEVARQAEWLYPATNGSLLGVTTLGTASPARPTGHQLSASTGLLAGAGGVAVAMVLVGLADLRRPRVRSGRDVVRVTAARSFPLPIATARDADLREGRLALLRSILPSWVGRPVDSRIAVLGVPHRAAELLVGELRAADGSTDGDGPGLVLATGPDPLALDAPVDGVVVVADGRSATRLDLESAVSTVRAAGRPLLGVVVEGLLPPGAGWRARLRAGLRGDGTWSRAVAEADTSGARAQRRLTRCVAVLALAALGFTRPLPFALSAGLLAAAVLLPLWAPAVRRYRGAVLLFVLTGLALVCGVLLTWLASRDHGFAPHEAVRTTVLLLTSVCGIGLILWARTVLPFPAIGVAFGVGNLAAAVLTVPGSDNPWKFELSFPVLVIVLSLVAVRGRPLVTVAALAGIGLVDVLNDYRSDFACCVLAAVLVLWQMRPAGRARQTSAWVAVPVFGALGAAGYWVLTQALLAGALGSELQQRTATQIAQSGSLLIGGRPEWTATWALMQFRPLGFGLGTVPTAEDTLVARAGLAVTHIPTVDSYLEHQLLNGAVQLHSIVADLWAATGPVGVLLGLAMAGLAVHGLADGLRSRRATGLVCAVVPLGLWCLAFGPLSDNLPTLTLALGLLLVARPQSDGSSEAVGAPAAELQPATSRA
jgi:capsular polysaccharide biosynthesis protein